MPRTVIPGKRWIKVLTRPKTLVIDPLALNERLVYSYLVSRVGTRRTYSQRRLSRYLQLNKNAFPKIKDNLVKHGLIGVNPQGRWFARTPDGEAASWFNKSKPDDSEWHQQYAYWRYYLPTPAIPLTFRHLAVYSLICSFGKFNGVSGLVKMLNISRPTVQAAIKQLVKHNLIIRQDNWLIARTPSSEKLSWFQDIGKFATTQSLVLKPGTALERRMKEYGISSGEISVTRKLLAEMTDINMYDPEHIRVLLDKAKAKHNPNKHAGKSPGALFIYMLKDYKADLAKSVEAERMAEMNRPHDYREALPGDNE
jgi:predicted DNA-binding transcriptional regulator